MNSTLYRSPESTQDMFGATASMSTSTSTLFDLFATTPMRAVTYHQENEEELHTSFENAISDRVLAMNRQRRLSGSLANMRCVELNTDALVKHEGFIRHQVHSHSGLWLAGLALMLLLVGFDLMGLLVLFMR